MIKVRVPYSYTRHGMRLTVNELRCGSVGPRKGTTQQHRGIPRWGLRVAYYAVMAMVDVRLQDGSVTQVPYPRVPPAPSISPGDREEMARQWLVLLSQAPSSERVEALAPLVGRFSPHSPLGRIASQFVAANRLPVHQDVIEAYLHRQAVAAGRRRVPPGPILPGAQARVLDLIDEHWAIHGCGPSWSQLGKQVDLDRLGVALVLRELSKAGVVTYTSAPGSVRRTPSADS